jgi:hypothetical protein
VASREAAARARQQLEELARGEEAASAARATAIQEAIRTLGEHRGTSVAPSAAPPRLSSPAGAASKDLRTPIAAVSSATSSLDDVEIELAE